MVTKSTEIFRVLIFAMVKFLQKTSLYILFLCLPILALGQDSLQTAKPKTTANEFIDLNLEQLLNIEVSVSSKTEERLSDAPGSITAYSNKDMEKLGYYTLRDLADITAGYSAFRGIGEITYETRGQKSDGFDNNKHLVLVDGIPFYQARANKANAEEDLPLFFAKRVEFLKGPGSALYGPSAFFGVMNILSKELDENGFTAEGKMSVGNYDFKRRFMANALGKSEFGEAKLALSYYGKDATRQYVGNGQNNNALSRYYDNTTSFFANASYKITAGNLKGLGIGFIYSRKTGGLGEFWNGQQNQNYESNQLTWEQVDPYLKYERKLTSKLSLNSYLKMNGSTEKGYVGGYQNHFNSGTTGQIGVSNYNVRVMDYQGTIEGKYALSQKSNFILGAYADSRSSSDSPESYAYFVNAGPAPTYQPSPTYYTASATFNLYSVYGQWQQNINFLKGLNITAGARMDMGRIVGTSVNSSTTTYDKLSPRIALVQKITNSLNLKLLYGAALRTPTVKEIGLNDEVRLELKNQGKPSDAALISNPTAETIHSFEAQATYNVKHLSFSVTGFQNRTQNAIVKISTPNQSSGQVNSNTAGTISAWGYETELQLMPSRNFKLGGNFSYAKAQTPVNTSIAGQPETTYYYDVANVPTSKVNGVLTYSLFAPVKVSFTLVGHFIDSYRAGYVERNSPYNNKLITGYKTFDLNTVLAITHNIGLELQVRNLLDTDIRTPAFFATGQTNIPYPKRSFLLTVSIKL